MRFSIKRLGAALLLAVLSTTALAEQHIRVGLASLPSSKGNPHSALIDYLGTWSAIFDPLTMVNDQGELMPWLATEWEQESPGQWLISLRPDITFSNGRALDADAVVAALGYLRSDLGRTEAVSRTLSKVIEAEAVSPLSVRIVTDGPSPLLPYELSLLRIPEPDHWSTLGASGFANDPIGTGPFVVSRWAVDQIALSANTLSWRPPIADQLTLQVARDPTNRLNALLTNQFDIVDGVGADMVPRLQEAGYVIRRNQVPGAMAIIFNTVKDPRLRDARVRQALNYAVNKTVLIDILLEGYAEPSSQPAPRMALGYNEDLEPYPYDPERARALLAEAGYKNDFAFVLEVSNGSAQNLIAYQQIASDLAQVGVEMEIRPILRPQFLQKFQQNAWEGSAFPLGYFSPALDALSIVEGNSCLRPNAWYCDEAIVPTIERALAESSLEQREALTKQIMRYNHETAIGLFLYEAVSLNAHASNISGYESHGLFVLYETLQKAP